MAKLITILTIGSRGDVQPFVALGKGLKANGYDVRIATHTMFEGFVTAHGLRFEPIPGDPRSFALMLATEQAGANMFTFMRQLGMWFRGFTDEFMDAVEEIIPGSDLLICGFLGLSVVCMAEKLGIPAVYASGFPIHQPTGAYPPVTSLFPYLDYAWLNRLAHGLERLGGYTERSIVNQWRTERLGLPPFSWLDVFPYGVVNGQPVTKLFAYSPHFIPRPDDYPQHTHVTGYWFLDEEDEWEPPADLVAYLDAGAPPVYVGFGSLIAGNPQQLVETVVEAVRASGNRLLLLSGWADYADVDAEDVFIVKEAPHDWLFPRMKAVVHHGGAGTTGAGLRAGVPTVVVPFFGDQVFWGRMIHKRGTGAEPVPASKLTAGRLAQAIVQATTSDAIRERAAKIGAAIRSEDGIGSALRVIESLL